ncbi:hypothetical protein CMT92_04565 [Elizabethkingia anophelis]|nr:hypothetical protein [Elizabethkingia anophelis]
MCQNKLNYQAIRINYNKDPGGSSPGSLFTCNSDVTYLCSLNYYKKEKNIHRRQIFSIFVLSHMYEHTS